MSLFGSAWKCKQCAIAKPIRDSGSAACLIDKALLSGELRGKPRKVDPKGRTERSILAIRRDGPGRTWQSTACKTRITGPSRADRMLLLSCPEFSFNSARSV